MSKRRSDEDVPPHERVRLVKDDGDDKAAGSGRVGAKPALSVRLPAGRE